MRLFDLLLAFVPSFLGYLDGYTDAASVVIANSCHSPLAQQLATLMGIAYLATLLNWQPAALVFVHVSLHLIIHQNI